MNRRIVYISLFILIAALTRIIPHPFNFAPLGAMALFGSTYFSNKKLAFALPLIAYFISDLLVNNILYADYYQSFVLFTPGLEWTYVSMLLIVLAGILIFNKINTTRVIGGALSASAIFFIISNLGVWISGTMYPPTFEGLIACYTAALPFLHTTIIGDLVYTGALFGGFEYLSRKSLVLKTI